MAPRASAASGRISAVLEEAVQGGSDEVTAVRAVSLLCSIAPRVSNALRTRVPRLLRQSVVSSVLLLDSIAFLVRSDEHHSCAFSDATRIALVARMWSKLSAQGQSVGDALVAAMASLVPRSSWAHMHAFTASAHASAFASAFAPAPALALRSTSALASSATDLPPLVCLALEVPAPPTSTQASLADRALARLCACARQYMWGTHAACSTAAAAERACIDLLLRISHCAGVAGLRFFFFFFFLLCVRCSLDF